MGKGPDLPALPALEAEPIEHLRFANQALRRKWNHIARVRKYGNVAPVLVLVFENREELRLSAQQHRYGAGLRDAMHAYDGIVCPAYTKPQLEIIFAALIKAADLFEQDAELETLLLDLNAFLVRCLLENDQAPLRRPDTEHEGELFRAIADLRYVNARRSGHPAEPPPVLLFWSGTDQDRWGNRHDLTELWIPRGALATFLRALRSWTLGAHLRSVLFSLGWEARDLHARATSDWQRREKSKVWVVPVPWEPADIDLQAVAKDDENATVASASVPTSPEGPLRSNAREGASSRARIREGDAGGRGDVRQKWDFSPGRPRRGEK